MAAVSQVLYQSGAEGSSVYINYDSVTLTATGLTLTCGPTASDHLIFWYMVGGVTTSLQANMATALATHAFPSALTGVAGTAPNGSPNISWGLSTGAGHGVAAPTPVTVVGGSAV